MNIQPPGKEDASAPPTPGPGYAPATVPPAPREAVMSLPPSKGAGQPADPMGDLPAPARSGEMDLVDDFDLVTPSPDQPKGAASGAGGVDLPGVPTPPPSPPAAKGQGVAQLDDAFELMSESDLESIPPDDPPAGGVALPAPAAPKDGGGLDFELDLPDPAAMPQVKADRKEDLMEPRSRTKGAKSPLETIAGMPTPLTTPIPDEKKPAPPPAPGPMPKKGATVMGMPAIKPPKQTPAPPIDGLEAPFGGLDLPAPATGAKSADGEFDMTGRPEPMPPAPRANATEDSASEFDLPTPAPSTEARPPAPKVEQPSDEGLSFDLDSSVPAPPEPAQSHRGEPTPLPPVLSSPPASASIPAPSLSNDAPGVDLDDPFGGIDLPAPAEAASGSDDFGGLDLGEPQALTPVAPADDTPGFGDLGLAEPEPSIPAPSEPIPEPEPSGSDDPFASLDLPTPQAPVQQAGADESAPAAPDPFADLDLPAESSAEASLAPPEEPQPPTPRDSKSSGSSDDRDIFAEITDEMDEPPKAGSSAVDDLLSGPASDSAGASETGQAGGTSFGEISLTAGEAEESASDDGAVDLPERKYGGTPGAADGMSLDLDALGGDDLARPSMPAVTASTATVTEGDDGAEEPAAKRSPVKLLLLLVLLLVVVGGGAGIYFSGLHMDIYKFGSKLLGHDIDAMIAERQKLLNDISGGLSADTHVAYTEGAGRVEKNVRATNDDIARAYLVYLAYSMQLRFGTSDEWDKKAEVNLRQLELGKELEREKELAVSAQKLFHGKDAKSAFGRLKKLRRANPKDVDATVLVALGGLTVGDGKKALDGYTALEKLEGKSARVLYGQIQALRLQGKNEQVEGLLAELIESYPDHYDGQIIKAKILIDTAQLQQAEVLLSGVSKVGEGKLGPGQTSTVNALLGRIHLEKQDTVGALKLFTEAEKADPHNVEAIVGLATIHLLNQEPAKALGRFKVAVSINPSSMDAQLGIIESHIDLANFAEAKKGLEALAKSYPDAFRVHHLKGRLGVALKEIEQAVTSYKKAIELNPAHLASYLELASMYFDTEQVALAMQVLEQAKQKLPPTANLRAAFGQGYIERGDLKGAIVELQAALDADPDHVQAHFLMGMAYYRDGEYETAKEMLDWVEANAPKYPGLILQQGLLFEALGDVKKAEQYYSQALAAQPDDLEIQIRTASILVSGEKYEEARTILDKVLIADPSNPEAMFYLGRVEMAEGQPVVALKLFKKSIRIRPNIAVYHLHAAMAQEASGAFTEALESADRALEIDDGLAEAYLVRGRLLVRMGTVKDGTIDLETALELKPDLIEAYAPLGKAAESLRKWDDAIEFYKKALEVDPKSGDIHVDLALILYERGDKNVAMSHFEKAVKLGRLLDTKPKWYFTGLYYSGIHKENVGDDAGALKIYEEYLSIAPLAAIDREDVENRVESINLGY